MDLRASAEQLEQTLRTMPVRSRVWLLLAIFLTFASLTLWSDASAASSGFWILVGAWAWLSGLIGVGYAVVGFGYRMLLPFVIAVNLLGPTLFVPLGAAQSGDPGFVCRAGEPATETSTDTGVRPDGDDAARVQFLYNPLAD